MLKNQNNTIKLSERCVVIFLSLIPSILIVAYFHGSPGRDSWTRFEKIGIPVNVILTAALLITFFSGKDLGAASKSVTIEDENGEKQERVIPKGQFRKKLVMFYFDN